MDFKVILILAALLPLSPLAAAQNVTRVVYGQTTTLNDLPVSGIDIKAKKAKTTTRSDTSGLFTIVCNTKDRLKITGKLFDNRTIKINEKTPDTINVDMPFHQSDKNVELAIGYGYIQEKDRTQAVEYTRHKNDYSAYLNIYDVIRCNFPTLQVDHNGCVIIRGPSSLYGSNCALFIVNGVQTRSIDYISPTDIKDISVIKDGSAAIYGCRGATGVILINLKTGSD